MRIRTSTSWSGPAWVAAGAPLIPALLVLAVPTLWVPALVGAVALLPVVAALGGRRRAAAAAIVGVQSLAAAAILVHPEGAVQGLLAYLIAAPAAIVSVGGARVRTGEASGGSASAPGLDVDERVDRYLHIFENIQVGLHVWRLEDPDDDASLRLIALNPAGAHLMDVDPEEALGCTVDDLAPGLRAQGLPALGVTVVRTGRPLRSADVVYPDIRGKTRVFSVRLFRLPDHCLGVAFEDVTDERAAADEIEAQARRWSALAEFGRSAVRGADLDEMMRTAVTLVRRALGTDMTAAFEVSQDGTVELRAGSGWPDEAGTTYEAGHRIHTMLSSQEPLVVPDLTDDDLLVPRRLLLREGIRSGLRVTIRGDAAPFGVLSSFSRASRSFSVGEIQFVEAIARTLADTIERSRNEDALRHLALHDMLTGLPNRTLLYDRLGQALAAAKREGRRIGLLLMDIDRFKEVNDTLGHHCGDLLLRAVGRRLAGELRGSDTVARLGGDEFAVVLRTIDDPEDARRAAARIERAFDTPFVVKGVTIRVRMSIGVAINPDHGEHVTSLLQHADVAMYAAKAEGQGGGAIYSADGGASRTGRLELLADLRRALESDELGLHYQPKVDLRSGRVMGTEALVRWDHPLQGPIPPGRFIPLAETAGLICDVTARVLSDALEQARTWIAEGLDLGVAVNISAHDLDGEHLRDLVADLLRRTGVPPDRLTLEITENGIMEDPGRAIGVLRSIRDLGVRLSVDDFGTGHSSLGYLRQLPVDEIKIDRSFVVGMRDDAHAVLIVRSIVDLGHKLGLEVVAEGVEDRAVWERVVEVTHCDLAQGYHIAHPLPPDAFTTWLDANAGGAGAQLLAVC